MAKTIKIGGELESTATGNVVAAASAIKDKVKNKYQSEINDDVARHETEIHGTGGIEPRLSDVEQMEQIVIDGGEAQIATGSDFTNPDSAKRAKIPTIGAIVDGLNDGIYDVSKRNPSGGPNSDGKFTLEYILSNADTLIPISWRHGGMIISFVDSSDNQYVQYRLMSQTFSTDVTQWQGVVEEVVNVNKDIPNNKAVFGLLNNLMANVPYSVKDYTVRANGTFGEGTNYQHAVIKVNAGQKYAIKHVETSTHNYVRYAFATSDEAVSGGDIPLVSGTSVVVVPIGETVVVTIPNGCNYLLVNFGSDYPLNVKGYITEVKGLVDSYEKRPFFLNAEIKNENLNYYFKELFVEGLDTETTYCLRTLRLYNNNYLVYIGTTSGSVITIAIPKTSESYYKKVTENGITVHVLLQNLNFTGDKIYQNTNTTICTLNKAICENIENSPYIASVIENERAVSVENAIKQKLNYEYAVISNIVPIQDTSANTFTLPTNTRISYVGAPSPGYVTLENDVVFSKSDSGSNYQSVFLILNISTFAKRYVRAIDTLILGDNEVLIALIRWMEGVYNGNFMKYSKNRIDMVFSNAEVKRKLEYSDYPSSSSAIIDGLNKKMFNPIVNLQKEGLKVLDIGNSYSDDATHYLSEIFESLNIQADFSLYKYKRASSSFKTIVDCYNDSDNKTYTISKTLGVTLDTATTGTGAANNGELFRNLLTGTKWDIIIIHQVSTYANDYSVWQGTGAGGYLNQLVQILRNTNPQAAIGSMIVHSYAHDYSGNTEGSTLLRWQNIANSIKLFNKQYGIDFVIPYGSAVECMRKTTLNSDDNDFSTDGLHMANGLGDYIASCVYYQSLIAPRIGISILGNTWRKTDFDTTERGVFNIDNTNAVLAQKAAMWATYNWYELVNPDNL